MFCKKGACLITILFIFSSFNLCNANVKETDYKQDEIIVKFAQKKDKTKLSINEKNTILHEYNCGFVKRELRRVILKI